jgi:hypothetical protein
MNTIHTEYSWYLEDVKIETAGTTGYLRFARDASLGQYLMNTFNGFTPTDTGRSLPYEAASMRFRCLFNAFATWTLIYVGCKWTSHVSGTRPQASDVEIILITKVNSFRQLAMDPNWSTNEFYLALIAVTIAFSGFGLGKRNQTLNCFETTIRSPRKSFEFWSNWAHQQNVINRFTFPGHILCFCSVPWPRFAMGRDVLCAGYTLCAVPTTITRRAPTADSIFWDPTATGGRCLFSWCVNKPDKTASNLKYHGPRTKWQRKNDLAEVRTSKFAQKRRLFM